MKKYVSITLSCLFLFISILQGCGLPNQPYVKKDKSEPQPLKVVRYETPPFRTYKTGNMITSIVVSGVLFGGIGAGLGYLIHRGLSEEPADQTRPDFGKLVMDMFIERAKNEIPSWPNMTVEDKTIKESLIDKSCYVLEIKVDDIRVEISSNTLITSTIITMKDKENNMLWQKGYAYDSTIFQRFNTVDALKADNYKLLKAEYAFAANKTVDDFITHFKNSSSMEADQQGKSIPVVVKSTVPSMEADQRYSRIKGIELMNGNVIEGQIISMNPDIIKIRTKDGRILSYSFNKEVRRFITE